MGTDYAPAAKNAMLQALADLIDAAETPGYIELYTATKPDPGVAITDQTLLGTLDLNDPCGTVANGILPLGTIEDDNLADSGDIDWARAFDGDGNWIADVDAGDLDSDAVIKLNSVTVYQGGICRLNSFNFTV